jgi:hypothetical protein
MSRHCQELSDHIYVGKRGTEGAGSSLASPKCVWLKMYDRVQQCNWGSYQFMVFYRQEIFPSCLGAGPRILRLDSIRPFGRSGGGEARAIGCSICMIMGAIGERVFCIGGGSRDSGGVEDIHICRLGKCPSCGGRHQSRVASRGCTKKGGCTHCADDVCFHKLFFLLERGSFVKSPIVTSNFLCFS